jgi:hypothetical protein
MTWFTRWRLNQMRDTLAGLIGKRDALLHMFKHTGEVFMYDKDDFVETERRIAKLQHKIRTLEHNQ